MKGRRLVVAVMAAGMALALTPGQADGQVVDRWNEVWIDSIRATKNQPGPSARQGAMLHASIQDAINSVTRAHRPHIYIAPEPVNASTDAAGAAAAHRVLSHFYPQRQEVFDATLESQLSRVSDSPQRERGVALGREVADAVIAARADDGSDRVVDYEYGTEPGDYRATAEDPPETPYNPEWPDVTPWTMEKGSQFRSPPPPALDSQRYAESLNQVRELGGRDSTVRTQEQTDIGYFWANDRQGTYLPIGHLNEITRTVARDHNLDTFEQARLFALTNIAMADAGIVSWDAKYQYDFWRPVTAIQEADTDGNDATEADPDWIPLYPVTPPFPAYTSGHATFAAAHAAVMEDFFGTDDITFSIGTDEPLYDGSELRTYDSFSEAAIENALSRIYIGVHYDFDAIYGTESGFAIGHYAFDQMAQPIPEPTTAALAMLAVAALGGLRRPSRGRG